MTGSDAAAPPFPSRGVRRGVSGDVAIALVACLPLAVLYSSGVQSTVGRGDSAEFVTAAYTLTLPHPPGYPIYTMLGRLCCLLPWGTIPLRVNILSAACAYLALALVFLALAGQVRSTTGSKVHAYAVGAAGVMLVGLSPAFWRYAVVAEAYAVNALAVTLFAYLALGWIRTAQRSMLWGASLVLGFAAGTHLSTVFLVPVLAGLVLIRARGVRALLAPAGFFAIGASQYVFVIVRAKRAATGFLSDAGLPSAAADTGTGGALLKGIWYITGGPWRDAHPRSFERLAAKLEELMRLARAEYGVTILVLALASAVIGLLLRDRVLGRAAVRGGADRPAGCRRGAGHWWYGALVLIILAQAVFYVSYGPSQIAMVLPSVICVGILAAGGLTLLARLAAVALPGRFRPAGSRVIALTALAGVVVWSVSRAPGVRPAEDGSGALVAQAIDRLPAGSYLAGVDYKHIMIINYYQVVEKRDVTFTWGGAGDRLGDDMIADGKAFVLGTPINLLRFGRAGVGMEPYLAVENAPVIYAVRAPGGAYGTRGQSGDKSRRAAQPFQVSRKRARTK